MIQTIYHKDVEGTIISPTKVLQQSNELYHGFTIVSDCDKGTGILQLNNRDGINHHTFDMTL